MKSLVEVLMDEDYDTIAVRWQWDGDRWRYEDRDAAIRWSLVEIDSSGVRLTVLTGGIGYSDAYNLQAMPKILAVGWMELAERGLKEKGLDK
jgi:hypothetical protein